MRIGSEICPKSPPSRPFEKRKYATIGGSPKFTATIFSTDRRLSRNRHRIPRKSAAVSMPCGRSTCPISSRNWTATSAETLIAALIAHARPIVLPGENTVYIDHRFPRRRLGYLLLESLIERVERTPVRQMIAVIGDSGHVASIKLHESLGFRMVGTLKGTGFKFDRWVDTVIMQKPINGGDENPPRL